jgi:LPS-assembly lipoprotein
MKRFRQFAIAALLVALGGCGFSPLYGTHGPASSPGVADALAKVAIRPLPNREGMKLRQVLREQLQPQGTVGSTVYDLDVKLTRQVQELGIRRDATASRANLVLVANFALNQGGGTVYRDSVTSVVGYNILDDQYATVAAQADAENRAIRQVGEEIKTRLAVYLARNPKPMAAAAP